MISDIRTELDLVGDQMFDPYERSGLWLPASCGDPSASTYMTAASTETAVPDLDEMRRIMAAFPKPEFDRVVTTKTIFEQLQNHPEVEIVDGWFGIQIAGLPVEVYRTPVEAYLRSDELRKQGWRPMLVLEEIGGDQ